MTSHLQCAEEQASQKRDVMTDVSEIPHVSMQENVGKFQNMRKECQIKTFDGLGPFSYVCRMISFEPNTTETGMSNAGVNVEDFESDFRSCGPQFETSEMSLTEKFIENRHYVCAIDEVSHEHFRGFPVEIDLEGPHRTVMRKTVGMYQPPKMKGKKSCPALQPHQILRLPRKSALQNLSEILRKRLTSFTMRGRSDHDPSMNSSSHTRPFAELTFRASETHFVLKITTFHAPAIYPNFTKYCACHEK